VGNSDQLSVVLQALADPTRRGILARLAEGEATVLELAEPFDLKLPTISKHLKVLQRAGLISQGRQAQWRPCRLEPAPLKEVADWVERYREIWEERFGQLDEYLKQLQQRKQHEEKDDDPERERRHDDDPPVRSRNSDHP
jgi:DNA-binding transcriptional ArsR family regulator